MHRRYADIIVFATTLALFALVATLRLFDIESVIVWLAGLAAGAYAWIALRYALNRRTGFWTVGPAGSGLRAVLRAASTLSFDLVGGWVFGASAGALSLGHDGERTFVFLVSTLRPVPWIAAVLVASLAAGLAMGRHRRQS